MPSSGASRTSIPSTRSPCSASRSVQRSGVSTHIRTVTSPPPASRRISGRDSTTDEGPLAAGVGVQHGEAQRPAGPERRGEGGQQPAGIDVGHGVDGVDDVVRLRRAEVLDGVRPDQAQSGQRAVARAGPFVLAWRRSRPRPPRRRTPGRDARRAGPGRTRGPAPAARRARRGSRRPARCPRSPSRTAPAPAGPCRAADGGRRRRARPRRRRRRGRRVAWSTCLPGAVVEARNPMRAPGPPSCRGHAHFRPLS